MNNDLLLAAQSPQGLSRCAFGTTFFICCNKRCADAQRLFSQKIITPTA